MRPATDPTGLTQMRDFIVTTQMPVVLMLVMLFWRAGKSLNSRSLQLVSVGWSLNLIYLILNKPELFRSERAVTVTVVGIAILNSASTACMLLAVLANPMFRRVGKRLKIGIVVLYILATAALPSTYEFVANSKGLVYLEALLSAAVAMALSLQYIRSPITSGTPPAKLARFLPLGFAIYSIDQLLAIFLLYSKPTTTESVLAVAFAIGLLSKFLMLIGLGDSLGALAAAGAFDAALSAESRRIIEQLYHEIGTPIAHMTTQITPILNDSKVSGQTRASAGLLENSKERILAILEATADYDLMLFGRAAARNMAANLPLTTESQRISQRRTLLVNSAIDTARMAVKDTRSRANIEFRFRYSAKCCIEAVGSEMVQIFINIFNNAYDACAYLPGQITIETKNDRPSLLRSPKQNPNYEVVRIVVSDNGEGIPDANLVKIFDEGFSTRKGLGRGHGLAIVRKLVEANGGQIHYSSDVQKDKVSGTVVTIEFPKVPCKTKFDR